MLSSLPESLKVKNRESDQYVSGEKVWPTAVAVMRNTRSQDSINTQLNTKQEDATLLQSVKAVLAGISV